MFAPKISTANKNWFVPFQRVFTLHGTPKYSNYTIPVAHRINFKVREKALKYNATYFSYVAEDFRQWWQLEEKKDKDKQEKEEEEEEEEGEEEAKGEAEDEEEQDVTNFNFKKKSYYSI